MAKVDLTPAKLEELRQKAEAAEKESPSPWHGGPDGSHWVLVDSEQGDIHTSCNQRNIADFIAHADPATVLAMVEEIETLKTALNLHMWEYWGTDLEQEDIDDLCKKQIEMAKKYRNESEAGQ